MVKVWEKVDNEIKLNGPENSLTSVPNIFIDNYMSAANEAQLKVYLYLLRCVSHCGFSINKAAEALNYSERDIVRALDYWHHQGLLSLDYANGVLCSVSMRAPSDSSYSVQAPSEQGYFPVHTTTDYMVHRSPAGLAMASPAPAPSMPENTQAAPVKPAKEIINAVPAAKFYSKDQLDKFNSQEDIKELLFITKEYFGRPLTMPETNSVLYIYDTLKFPPALIEYLIEYCVDKGHRSMKYIEKVAISWHEDGVRDVSAAKIRTASFADADQEAVRRAFGISNRVLGQEELRYVRKWKNELGFDMELILLAVDRCLITTGNASFKYVDKTLENWKKLDIQTPEDVALADKVHRSSRKNTASTNTNSPPPGDQFRNYSERNYDYTALEKEFAKN